MRTLAAANFMTRSARSGARWLSEAQRRVFSVNLNLTFALITLARNILSHSIENTKQYTRETTLLRLLLNAGPRLY
jgi:hypothetical protein